MKFGQGLKKFQSRVSGANPSLKDVTWLCWIVFCCIAAIVLVVVAKRLQAGEGFDFVYFYGTGSLAKLRPVTSLYDYSAQLRVFNQIAPSKEGAYGPSPYPPFVALFFSFFTALPFKAAYLLWMLISLVLYIGGIRLAMRAVSGTGRDVESLILCFALAYPPFLLYALVNGQLASVAVGSVGAAVFFERHQRPFLSGMALAILAYKPTLLVLILPMLLLTRRIKALAGFSSGAAILFTIPILCAGIQIWESYLHLLSNFRQLSMGQASGITGHLRRWQYVDLNSFSYAVPGGRSRVGAVVLLCVGIALATWLASLLWRSEKGAAAVQNLAWATTITWTLLLNVYVPLYDSILVVLAIILTLAAVKDLHWSDATVWVGTLAALIFAVSWGTRAFAEHHGIQLLTVALLALGALQARLIQQALATASPAD